MYRVFRCIFWSTLLTTCTLEDICEVSKLNQANIARLNTASLEQSSLSELVVLCSSVSIEALEAIFFFMAKPPASNRNRSYTVEFPELYSFFCLLSSRIPLTFWNLGEGGNWEESPCFSASILIPAIITSDWWLLLEWIFHSLESSLYPPPVWNQKLVKVSFILHGWFSYHIAGIYLL